MRAAVLAVVVVLLVLTLAWPLTLLLRQNGDLAELAATEDRLAEEVASLQARRDDLSDPAVVEAEARARLGMARPGEDLYLVVSERPDDPASSPGGAPRLTDALPGAQVDEVPWWERLLGPEQAGGSSGAGADQGDAGR